VKFVVTGLSLVEYKYVYLDKVCAQSWGVENTGCFIMYSTITKIYYRKTVGHIFMNPVQIDGTTQKFYSW
jgi:hypothetical protein